MFLTQSKAQFPEIFAHCWLPIHKSMPFLMQSVCLINALHFYYFYSSYLQHYHVVGEKRALIIQRIFSFVYGKNSIRRSNGKGQQVNEPQLTYNTQMWRLRSRDVLATYKLNWWVTQSEWGHLRWRSWSWNAKSKAKAVTYI